MHIYSQFLSYITGAWEEVICFNNLFMDVFLYQSDNLRILTEYTFIYKGLFLIKYDNMPITTSLCLVGN